MMLIINTFAPLPFLKKKKIAETRDLNFFWNRGSGNIAGEQSALPHPSFWVTPPHPSI